ncbi:putative serpin-like protein, partial [Stegodyphus mimosarum]
MNVYKLLAKEEKNTFFSPFSLSTALAMVFCGSENETAKEIRLAIGYNVENITGDNIKSGFQQLLSTLEKASDNYVLNYANSLLSQKGFAVKEEYKLVLRESFRALLMEMDFVGESEKVINHINEWVKNKTNHMIPQLVDFLDPSTVMVILNAVYFKGTWSHKFNEKLTFRQNFYNKGTESSMKLVDMMHIKESFLYSEKGSFKALQLPYHGEEIAMLLLLPNSRNGLKELEKQLSADFFKDLKCEMLLTEVDVALPKFRLEYSKSMKEIFQELGIRRLFECGAELGGISDYKELMVSEVIHKAVIIVNEEGTEAAAATFVGFMRCSLTFNPEFIVDHPFAFVIYNTKCDLIIFMGKVEEL